MEKFRSGFISVIGVPNAGKSSLVNSLVKESVSIVTAKPQTTRKRTLGVLTRSDRFQMIFTDTPGVIDSELGLNKFLRQELTEALKHVDVVVAAVAPWEFNQSEKPWVLQIKDKIRGPVIFIATQTDKFQVPLDKWTAWAGPEIPLLKTSSKTGEGLDVLLERILQYLPEHPPYYDEEIFTPQTMREIAAETIRKHAFEMLHQEVPYGMAVHVQRFQEGSLHQIEADIIVSRHSHKGMVIGQGGRVLKQIGTRARYELEKIFEVKIYLKLHVVVKPDWMNDKNWMQELGYAIP